MNGDWLRHALLCWPSTAGTGSEVSASATVWDRSGDKPQKLTWQPPHGHADEAWIDPVLCLTNPPKVTRDAALDALAHALESLWNVRANAMTRPLAERAVRLVMAHLPTALAQALTTRTQQFDRAVDSIRSTPATSAAAGALKAAVAAAAPAASDAYRQFVDAARQAADTNDMPGLAAARAALSSALTAFTQAMSGR